VRCLVRQRVGVVPGRARESRRGAERENGRPRHRRTLERMPAEAAREQIEKRDPQTHERRTVEVRPEGQQRDDPPDPPGRQPLVRAEQQHHGREEHEREQLRADSHEREQSGNEHDDDRRRDPGVRCTEPARVALKQCDGRNRRDGLRPEEPAIAEPRLKAAEDELGENRHVVPPVGGSSRVGNPVWQRAEAHDRAAQRGEPARVGADRSGHCDQGGRERDGGSSQPGKLGARPSAQRSRLAAGF
jgi:hypothetical protein